MPSVFTIAGTDAPRKPKKKRKAKRNRPGQLGECQSVYNPRNKRTTQLCFVGKSKKHPTGWAFQKK